jgi:hypothetical protein
MVVPSSSLECVGSAIRRTTSQYKFKLKSQGDESKKTMIDLTSPKTPKSS